MEGEVAGSPPESYVEAPLSDFWLRYAVFEHIPGHPVPPDAPPEAVDIIRSRVEDDAEYIKRVTGSSDSTAFGPPIPDPWLSYAVMEHIPGMPIPPDAPPEVVQFIKERDAVEAEWIKRVARGRH